LHIEHIIQAKYLKDGNKKYDISEMYAFQACGQPMIFVAALMRTTGCKIVTPLHKLFWHAHWSTPGMEYK
jgi:hypothetical protein